MLLDTMNLTELANEVLTDWEKAAKSLERIGLEYTKQRKRLKISRDEIYRKIYEIKTKKKNKWIFILSKVQSDEKYNGSCSIEASCFVYFYTSVGLRVIKIVPEGGFAIFNGHLFSRYNERMKLKLIEPLEMVKHFFFNNGFCTSKELSKDGRAFTFGIVKDGILLGEIHGDWIVYKTFVTRDLITPNQCAIEDDLVTSLQDEIREELNNPEKDKVSHYYKSDILKVLKVNG